MQFVGATFQDAGFFQGPSNQASVTLAPDPAVRPGDLLIAAVGFSFFLFFNNQQVPYVAPTFPSGWTRLGYNSWYENNQTSLLGFGNQAAAYRIADGTSSDRLMFGADQSFYTPAMSIAAYRKVKLVRPLNANGTWSSPFIGSTGTTIDPTLPALTLPHTSFVIAVFMLGDSLFNGITNWSNGGGGFTGGSGYTVDAQNVAGDVYSGSHPFQQAFLWEHTTARQSGSVTPAAHWAQGQAYPTFSVLPWGQAIAVDPAGQDLSLLV